MLEIELKLRIVMLRVEFWLWRILVLAMQWKA